MAAKPETADTIEAECTACSDAQFKIRYDKRSENFSHGFYPPFHSPDRDRFMEILERQFEEHVRLVHPRA